MTLFELTGVIGTIIGVIASLVVSIFAGWRMFHFLAAIVVGVIGGWVFGVGVGHILFYLMENKDD